MRFVPHVLSLADFPTILAGHGIDLGTSPRGDSTGNSGDGGLSLPWIIAVIVLIVATIGILISLNPSAAAARLKTVVPATLLLLIIAGPLVAWTSLSKGAPKGLMVERAIGVDGAPELLVSLGDAALNTLKTTNGKLLVRISCVGRSGDPVLDVEQKWPFIDEPGYKYPHAHQPARRDQLQRVDRCRLRGTSIVLEAAVKGALAP